MTQGGQYQQPPWLVQYSMRIVFKVRLVAGVIVISTPLVRLTRTAPYLGLGMRCGRCGWKLPTTGVALRLPAVRYCSAHCLREFELLPVGERT
jgi:hypothetical protein